MVKVILIGVVAIFLSACGGTKPSRFYSLTPAKGMTGSVQRSESNPRVAIGIGTLKLPEYLLRQQIVKRTASNELYFAEFDRWAESLEVNFSRVLIEDLSVDVPTNNVYLMPARDSGMSNYQVLLEITEFEKNASGTMTLVARWGVVKGENISYLLDKRSAFTEQVDDNYEAIAMAMSRLTAKLSQEIAAEIRRQSGKNNVQ